MGCDAGCSRIRQTGSGWWKCGHPSSVHLGWLVTNLERLMADLVGLPNRRRAIKGQLWDTTGSRFELGLIWTQVRIPTSLCRRLSVGLVQGRGAGTAGLALPP